jgi:uncharacterized phage protein (TIGR01671 family)
MKEIKFRAWNTREKNIKYSIMEDFSEITDDIDNVLMQYTGLKDKNGKDIYEGDILLNTKYGKAEVVFQYGCFGIDIYSPYKFGNGFNSFATITADYENSEVIGNVYENPNLINKI